MKKTKTFCKNGHEINKKNTRYKIKGGWNCRVCLECKRIYERKNYAEKTKRKKYEEKNTVNCLVQKRFWSKVKINKETNCYEWTKSKTYDGYGLFKFIGVMKKAHRVSYNLTTGKIPNGLHVLHKCDNRKCVNPMHLFLGTNKDNVDDRVNKNRTTKNLKDALKTHCPSGHEYTDKNTLFYKKKNGRFERHCKSCNVIRSRLYRAKSK